MAKIYVVATPIGNLKDMTLRAIDVLKESELIICEDTRVSSRLLQHYGIKSKLESLNEFNEDEKSYELLNKINSLNNVSLISDAGTPLLSDPGYKFINRAFKKGHKVIPVPGASAVLSALVVSQMPTDKFTFLGFLPKSQTKQAKILSIYKNLNHTIVFYESPHRIVKTLENLKTIFGNVNVSVSRELTKKFEEVQNKQISEILEKFKTKPPKGEFTVVLNPTIKES